jgi:hypothetical protein
VKVRQAKKICMNFRSSGERFQRALGKLWKCSNRPGRWGRALLLRMANRQADLIAARAMLEVVKSELGLTVERRER